MGDQVDGGEVDVWPKCVCVVQVCDQSVCGLSVCGC